MWRLLFFIPVLLYGAIYNSQEVEERLENLAFYPTHIYPYSDLPDELEEQGMKSFPIFSYGSLVNTKSAQRTLSEESMETRRPSLALGVIRVFDRDVAIRPNSHWGQPNDPGARGMLNLEVSDDRENVVNGVSVDVTIDDLREILSREVGYDLVPVVCMDWEESLNKDPNYYIAWTFVADQEGDYVSNDIRPRPGYYEASRDGAKEFGAAFYYLWLHTTYFGDGETSILQWEQRLRKGDPRTGIQPSPITKESGIPLR